VRPFLIVAAVSAVAAFAVTPVIRRVAIRLRVVDVPTDRKVHAEPTPLLGGVVLYVAIVVGVIAAWTLPEFRALFRESSEPVGIILAATALVVLGVVDDVRDLRPATKLAGQLIVAGILVRSGVQIFYIWLPGVGIVSLSSDLAALVTALWTVAIVNAVNLIDGLDGLAVGVTAIAAGSFFIYAHQTSGAFATTAELLTAVTVGACIGILRFNFSPATIFIGDAGAYVLGLILASATMSAISRTTEPQFIDVAGFIVPALVPFVVLAIPLADVGFAIARRMRRGRPVFHADKAHIHHWLLDMAGSHRSAVLVMYLWSAMISASALVLALGPGTFWRAVSLSIMGLLALSILVLPRALRRLSAGRVPGDVPG